MSFSSLARLGAGLGLVAHGMARCATASRTPPDPAYLAEIYGLLSAPGDPEIYADKAKGLAASGDKLSADWWAAYVFPRISPDRTHASREVDWTHPSLVI